MAQSPSPLKPATPAVGKIIVRDISMPASDPVPSPKSPVIPAQKSSVPTPVAQKPVAPLQTKPAASVTKPQATSAPGSAKTQVGEAERRRSQRVLLIVQVEVSWVSKDGIKVKEHAETEVVSQHGAMLKMETKLTVGAQMEITRPVLSKTLKARVVGTSNPGQDGMARVAIELLSPSDNFWGISFPPVA